MWKKNYRKYYAIQKITKIHLNRTELAKLLRLSSYNSSRHLLQVTRSIILSLSFQIVRGHWSHSSMVLRLMEWMRKRRHEKGAHSSYISGAIHKSESAEISNLPKSIQKCPFFPVFSFGRNPSKKAAIEIVRFLLMRKSTSSSIICKSPPYGHHVVPTFSSASLFSFIIDLFDDCCFKSAILDDSEALMRIMR